MNNSALKQKLTPILRFRSLAILLVVMVVLLVGPGIAASSTIPTIAITGVAVDQTVTIQTYNYPANQNFVVTMGPMGSQGIDGHYVSTINSGNGGSFPATFAIPDQLKGSSQIAIRLQSAQGFSASIGFITTQPTPALAACLRLQASLAFPHLPSPL